VVGPVVARCDEDELLMLEQIKTYKIVQGGASVLWRGDGLTYVASRRGRRRQPGKTMEDGDQMVALCCCVAILSCRPRARGRLISMWWR